MKRETRKHRSGATFGSKAWKRFRAHRRGFFSLIALAALYAAGLAAELISNDKPLILVCGNRVFFPAVHACTEDDILGNGSHLRMTSYAPEHLPEGSRAVYAPFRSGPDTIFTADDIAPHRRITVSLEPEVYAAGVYFDKSGRQVRAIGDTHALAAEINALDFGAFSRRAGTRFSNLPDKPFSMSSGGVEYRMPAFEKRVSPPEFVRIDIVKDAARTPWKAQLAASLLKDTGAAERLVPPGLDAGCAAEVKSAIAACAASGYSPPIDVLDGNGDKAAEIRVEAEPLSWPFRPVPGHPMGFDAAGRDVLARLLYGMRTSMTFGLALVFATMLIGIAAGAVQGYFAGWVDITGQRLTEIWCALPFLYIMILLGNTFGRGFGLLLISYAIFNWAGAAAYVRAEFLRLRSREFVDAARCQGLSGARIMFRHILPNAVTPLITLFPFSLVGAIGSLTMLDYLGFGMPDTAPSWGALLQQAQAFRRAWWLILYPSAALFVVMLLGVFVGEGMRDAMDPRPYSRTE